MLPVPLPRINLPRASGRHLLYGGIGLGATGVGVGLYSRNRSRRQSGAAFGPQGFPAAAQAFQSGRRSYSNNGLTYRQHGSDIMAYRGKNLYARYPDGMDAF